jgi:predicted DNA-binding transcriptional regulator AlpA
MTEGQKTLLTRAPVLCKGMSRAELLALPVAVDLPTAARALGLGRSTAYELARRHEFPCRVLQVGSSYRVPTAELLGVLGVVVADREYAPPAA